MKVFLLSGNSILQKSHLFLFVNRIFIFIGLTPTEKQGTQVRRDIGDERMSSQSQFKQKWVDVANAGVVDIDVDDVVIIIVVGV